MATVPFTIPDGRQQEYIDAMCWKFGYQATINGVANPETKGQFAKRQWGEFAAGVFREYKRDLNRQAAAVVVDIPIT